MKIMVKFGLNLNSIPMQDPTYYTNIKKTILSGFFMQTAHLQKAGHYMTMKDD